MKSMAQLCLIFLCLAASVSHVNAVTLSEYDEVDRDTQSGALAHIIIGTHNHFAKNGASQSWLNCLRAYFTGRDVEIQGTTVRRVPGIESILDQIDLARDVGDLDVRLEDIVLGVINAECGEPQ